jgi:hypothetical protein
MQLGDNLQVMRQQLGNVDKSLRMWITILSHFPPGSKWLKVTPLVRNAHQPYIGVNRIRKFESR